MLIATGSEVQLAVAAQTLLADNDILARVVSMPWPPPPNERWITEEG
nr:transketolase C-terminal domain-containing protein [Mycobacterium tuberculosis]